MEEGIFFAALVLLVLFGPWVLLIISRRNRKRERMEDQQRWGDLTSRIFRLEQSFRDLKDSGRPARVESAEPAAEYQAERYAPPKDEVAPPLPRPIDRPISVPPPFPITEETPGAEAPSGESVEPSPFLTPSFTSKASAPSLMDRLKGALDIEETLGTNWLNKLGIGLVVLGVAFLLALELKTLGPPGKVLVGYIVSAAMLGAGIWFERNERYRILARAGIGGGWALLFFTTYAMYHVPAAHVLNSQSLDLVLMLAVAAVMVWHTLRYRSQTVTGLAFLLAFLTVAISHDTVYSLAAGGVLAAALVVIVGRMKWFELEVFGILASYLNHYLWLRTIIEPMNGHRHPFPEFTSSAGMMLLYWLIFRLSYVFRLTEGQRQERISTAAALLNTTLLLALFKYQSTHPEWAFWALLAIGAVETLLAQLPVTRRRRTAVIVLNTLGVILLIGAFPFRYSGTRLSVLWVLEAEALLLIGVWTGEIIFRRLGMLAAGLVAGQMISVDAAAVAGRRMDGADLRGDLPLSVFFGVAAAVFYGNAHWVLRRWSGLFEMEFDRRVMQRLSYVAAGMALVGAWIGFPEVWPAVAWGMLALALTWIGRRFAFPELGYQACVIALLSMLRALSVNLESTDVYHGISLRLITVSIVVTVLYASSNWRIESGEFTVLQRAYSVAQLISDAYTWAGSLLLMLLAWYELRSAGVAVAWTMAGMVLLEVGLNRKSLSLRCQAHLAFAAGFIRIFFVNLNAAGSPGEISPRFYTLIPIAFAFFYGYWRLEESSEQSSEESSVELSRLETRLKASAFCCYLGTITVASLMRFELAADWVATAWAALAFALLAVAWRSGRRVFLHQGLLICFAVLFRGILHNLYERSYFPASGWETRWVCVGSVVAILFATLPIAFRLRRKDEVSIESGLPRLLGALARRPEQVFFFTSVSLLTVLLAVEMRHGMVTLAWGVEGVALFMFALWVGERSFRLSGLGLLLLCVAKILVMDVWRIDDQQARYLTLIVVGSALLLVSFLYTRNRAAISRYL